MFSFDEMPIPTLGLTGLEVDLTEEEHVIQNAAHHFALNVMRPIGEKLDKLTPEQVIAPESPLWSYAEQLQISGLLDLQAVTLMDNAKKARILPLVLEELGFGDSGLLIFSLATSFPAFAAFNSGDPQLIEQFGSRVGCWLSTQPNRGSDVIDPAGDEVYPGTQQNEPNLIAKIDGDSVILNGQSSAWISGGPVAKTSLVYCSCDYGDGISNGEGGHNQIALLVDLEDSKVSKGKPLDKLGQRPLPQGEIFFDELRVPKKNMLAGKNTANGSLLGALTFGNMEMGLTFTGVARAAFEHALAHVHKRKQGGTELINHQSVRLRIFDLWRRLESARALAHRAVQYNYSSNGPHMLASISSKTFATQTAFEIASESIQLMGGVGLTKEYPLEKLMRDARASMIEDGENTMLSIKGASWLSKWYQENH